MENILELLYTELSHMKTPDYPGREKDLEEYWKMCDLIGRQYGVEFMDHYSELQERVKGDTEKEKFFSGFRACARLILEALKDD